MVMAAGGLSAGTLIAGCAAQTRQATDGPGAGSASLDVNAFRAQRRFVQASMGRIAYIDRGSGPAALFLHAYPLNGFQWRGVIERISEHRRCVAPDFMGLGYTDIGANQNCAPQAQVEMLAALLDRLSLSSVDLIASDSGGLIAQLFMLAYPNRIKTLLLTNCDVEPYSPPPAFLPILKLARAGMFGDKLIAPWLADKELARSAQGLGGQTYTFPEKLSDETIDYYLTPLVSSPERKAQLHAFALALDPNPLAGIESALRRCETRTRIVWGTGDNIFSPASPDYLDQILPNSQGVRRVSGAKVFFPEEYSELIAEELRKLWGVG